MSHSGAAEPPRKRAAPTGAGALDQLPYQRKACFKRRVHASLEDTVLSFVDAGGADATPSATSGSGAPGAALQPNLPLVSVALGRIVGSGNDLDIALPIATEAVLQGEGHEFQTSLPAESFVALAERLEEERSAWQRAPGSSRRWANISASEQVRPTRAPSTTLTIYCPGGKFHYQVRVRSALSQEAVQEDMPLREVVYTFTKDSKPDGMWWSVVLRGDPASPSGDASVEISLNPRLLWGQRLRMKAGQVHAFSLAVRDLLRNARSLLGFLRSGAGAPGSMVTRCYYPGLLDSSAEVKKFYSERAQMESAQRTEVVAGNAVATQAVAAKAVSLRPSEDRTKNIRRYNNLVKVLQVEEFVDCMPSPLRVLDLGCGRGQDILKWARSFRPVLVKNYVGVDFAEEAVVEAKRRHDEARKKKAALGEEEYPATFYSGDLRDPATFQQLIVDNHTCFDVISLQFVLNYLASSEACMRDLFKRVRSLLRPGGRVLASITNSDALGDHFARGMEERGAAPMALTRGVEISNSLFTLAFNHEVWQRLDINNEQAFEEAFSQKWGYPYVFSLVGAVEGQEEYNLPWEAFEELVTGLGFRILLDGRFPEVYSAYTERSRYYKGVFSQAPDSGLLSKDEEELFGLYSAFVLERL